MAPFSSTFSLPFLNGWGEGHVQMWCKSIHTHDLLDTIQKIPKRRHLEIRRDETNIEGKK